MSFNPAMLKLEDDENPPIYLFLRIGGQPTAISQTLTQALTVGRRGLTASHFAARLCAAIGLRSIREVQLLLDPPTDPVRWVYDIWIDSKPRIRFEEISDAGVETVLYDGLLENYLTKQFRSPRKRRNFSPGRPPDPPESENESDLAQTILNERAQAESPHLNLQGVRVFSREEYEARKRAEKKARRERNRTERKNS